MKRNFFLILFSLLLIVFCYSESFNVISENESLCYFSGKILSYYYDDYINYKLEVFNAGENIYTNNNQTFFVMKNHKLRINYSGGEISNGGGNSEGSHWSQTHTELHFLKNDKSLIRYEARDGTYYFNVEEDMYIEIHAVSSNNDGYYNDQYVCGIAVFIDEEGPTKPEIEQLEPDYQLGTWTGNNIKIKVNNSVDYESGLKCYKNCLRLKGNWIENNIFETNVEDECILEDTVLFYAEDNVGNASEKLFIPIKIDRKKPVINCTLQTSPNRWTNQAITVSVSDSDSGLSKINIYKDSLEIPVTIDCEEINNYIIPQVLFNQTGIYTLKASDVAGNEIEQQIYIDKTLPEFNYNIQYSSEDFSKFNIQVYEINDEHSGINNTAVSVTILSNGIEETRLLKKNEYSIYELEYKLSSRDINNNVSFIIYVKDNAGNVTSIRLGGEQGYFIPARIYLRNQETVDKEVEFKFSDYNENTIDTFNYKTIKIQRNFYVSDNILTELTDANFSQYFNEEIRNTWKELEIPIIIFSKESTNNINSYKDREIKNSGFYHKTISYDCIYEYENPVHKNEIIVEKTTSDKLVLSNNKAQYLLKVKGDNNSHLVIKSNGEILEGSPDAFEMPETGVVGIEVKVEDKDIEPYKMQIQGMVELTSQNGKFKLQETDTLPVGAEGAIAGCSGYSLNNDTQNCFITYGKTMTNGWIDLGQYALQYNITTIFNIEFTEGFTGQQEQWTDKTIRLYAKAPSVLGGKARLIVGDASSYNADGITARPWQKIKMEVLPADENQTITGLTWDFGNGRTSESYGEYNKISNFKFEDIYYEQSETRMGALSEYKLKIRSGTDEAEFKVNIIDTQWGELCGNEVWRGEHIIKKEIIVPNNRTLQIGDTEHSGYDNDITCLCVGKINPEDKGGITVEQGGTLIIDEGDSKTIRFVQGIFKNEGYNEADENERSPQNKWNGITIKGELKGDSINITDADYGLKILAGGKIELSDSIKVERCNRGISMKGISLKAKEISLRNCSGYGIKLDSIIDCEKLFISNCERGGILTENGNFFVDNLEIKNCTTGLHLLGGKLEIGKGSIQNCKEYGIKTDNDGNYKYDKVIFSNNERNIYADGLIR